MKKLLTVLLLLLACTALLCACDDDVEPTVPTEHTHSWGEWSVTTAANCKNTGVKKHVCTICATEETETIAKTNDHQISSGVCTVCNQIAYQRTDDQIIFGAYPQSEVDDTALIATLNASAGALPKAENAGAWTSYGYYLNGEIGHYMWYIDVNMGTERYRGVYFPSYRPDATTNSVSTGRFLQSVNGYAVNTAYWFKYEPIAWTVLSEQDGTALLLSRHIIDAQEYHSSVEDRTEDGETIHPNNYASSTIRAWLNDNFYHTAFDDLQKQLILITTVDNSKESTGNSSNSHFVYDCEDTEDRIFLLSTEEVTKKAYGFNISQGVQSTTRQKATTDYAQCQGAFTGSTWSGKGYWWLRSPRYSGNISARFVDYDGSVDYYTDSVVVSFTDKGVVPALQIRLT